MDPWHLLAWSVVIGTTAPGVAIVLRALPAIERLVLEGTRPWACDVCLSWWCAAVTTLVAAFASHDLEVLWAAGPAYPFAYKLLVWFSQPTSVPPPAFPEPEPQPEPPAPPTPPAEAAPVPEVVAADAVVPVPEAVEVVKRKRGRPRKVVVEEPSKTGEP